MSDVSQNPNLKVVFSVTLMAVMGVASITPAFPTIIEQFTLAPPDVGILITAFTLPGIFLTPILGVLADRLGRKAILVPSLLLFGIAGGAITLTDDFQVMVILRVFQGVGATSLGLLNVTLIGDLFPPKDRAEAMGYNASVLSLGTASYPAIGGFLAGLAWYAPFYLPLIAVGVALLVLFKLEIPQIQQKQNAGEYLRNAWRNVNHAHVWKLFLINVLTFIILYGALLSYFPILMRRRFDAPEWQIGLYMSLFSVATGVTSSQLKRFARRWSTRFQLSLSLVLYAFGLALVGQVSNQWVMLLPIVIFGVGHGLLLPTVQTLLVGFAPIQERAVFMSVNGMVLRIGQTLGPLVMGALFIWGNLEWVYLGGAGIALLMLLIWWLTRLPKSDNP
ncbi:MAG: MFS transporter [Deltaproteobacteria bacterium]|nr:MFS transporter [Deltaproteobacteria bacterium]MBN2670657.1 MFS transporter [Deltaproteobacteria bacterium]